jgi:predicted dehydrogenase
MKRKIRMGMIGGGKGAFIGAVHHMAAVLDNQIDMVCGAFSSDPANSLETGRRYFLPDARCYGSWEEMIRIEKSLSADVRMDFVCIVTPNSLHFPNARLALENGFHVMCDKPVTFSLAEARELQALVKKTGLLFGLTHTYTGYPMVREARELIKTGRLGKIWRVMVEYPQGWLASQPEHSGNRQAGWRLDPARAGVSCTQGDVGVHAANLAEFITGLEITQLCADLYASFPDRKIDDDGSALLRFNNGARGTLTASQVCSGEENALKIRIYGEKGGLEWHQMEPNTLLLKPLSGHQEIIRTGVEPLSDAARAHTRVPAGHPEGYIEAFANLYRNFALALNARIEGKSADPLYDFPGIEEGVRGMRFIEGAVKSSAMKEKWLDLSTL